MSTENQRNVQRRVSKHCQTPAHRQEDRKADPTVRLILYGSRARGDHRKDSDRDVLVLLDRDRISERDIITHYRCEKALTAIEEAKECCANARYSLAIQRLYYSAYYAVSA